VTGVQTCALPISQSDIFRALIALTSVTRGGIQFAIDLPDQPGSIKVAGDIVRKYGGRMVSILSTFDRVAEGRRKVYIRMKSVDRSKLMQIKDELSQVGVLLYILDSREHTKELINVGRPGPA
jgi:acetoin utilization protein AcuB